MRIKAYPMPRKLFKFIKKIYNIERLVIFLLLVIISAQILGAFFVVKKMNHFENELRSLNQIYHNLNNDQEKEKEQLSQLQSLVVRLQALLYRQNDTEEEN